jgi:hypothetical protein
MCKKSYKSRSGFPRVRTWWKNFKHRIYHYLLRIWFWSLIQVIYHFMWNSSQVKRYEDWQDVCLKRIYDWGSFSIYVLVVLSYLDLKKKRIFQLWLPIRRMHVAFFIRCGCFAKRSDGFCRYTKVDDCGRDYAKNLRLLKHKNPVR